MKLSEDDDVIQAILNFYEEEPRVLSPLLAALEDLWKTLRVLHPSLPEVTIYVVPQRTSQYYGWAETERDNLIVTTVATSAGPDVVFTTVLHEAAHFLAYVDGVQDYTESGWHTEDFKTYARRLGLKVLACDYDGYGWSNVKPRFYIRRALKRHVKAIKEAMK